MKRYLFVLIILSTVCYSQTLIRTSTEADGKPLFNYVDDDLPMPNKNILTTISVRDSVEGIDTMSYNFLNTYSTCYITMYNSNVSTPDTLVFEHYSAASVTWATDVGLKDILTDTLESDNTEIILAASAIRTFEMNILAPGNYRIRPKTLTGRTSAKEIYVVSKGIN